MLNSILSDYKDLIATLVLATALVILVVFHTATFADIQEFLRMILVYWFFRGGISYAQGALARLTARPPAEEEKRA